MTAEIRSLLAATGAPALQQGSVTGIGIPAIDGLNKAARFQYEYEDQPVRTWGSQHGPRNRGAWEHEARCTCICWCDELSLRASEAASEAAVRTIKLSLRRRSLGSVSNERGQEAKP